MGGTAIGGGENIILIDDKESYVMTAVKLGWKGIHYSEFIDPNEAIRAQHTDQELPETNCARAKNITEVVSALKSFGVTFKRSI